MAASRPDRPFWRQERSVSPRPRPEVHSADSTQISGTNPNDGGAAYSWAWDESATLTLANKLAPKSIRFGTDANGLAADQLAKIRYDESVTTKTVVFTLDAEGYLRDNLDRGIFMRIR